MSDLIAIYDQLVIALRGNDDVTARTFFHPDFQVHEDPGMPYGGTFHGADGFIALRRKVRTYWQLEILSKCVAPQADRLVIVLRLSGQPEGPVATMATMVTVVWTFREGKASEATVLYFNTPPIARAITSAA